MTHEAIKAEVLAAAKAAKACADQYRRAAQATTHEELSAVMRENFHWLVDSKVLTGETIDRWKPVGIVHNQDVSDGYCLTSGSSTVRAFGSSTVRAHGSSTVEAYGSSTVEAHGSSTVRAYGSSTVEAHGSSTVRAHGSSTVRAHGSSTVEAFGSSTVHALDSSTVRAYDSSTVRALDSSTVEAYGSSYINHWSAVEVSLSGKAIARVKDKYILLSNGTKIDLP